MFIFNIRDSKLLLRLQTSLVFFIFAKFKLSISSGLRRRKMQFKYVRIYFDATTFDIVTKDRAAKFVDMISALGGTLGLFTGFSIISAFEIVFFGIKIIFETFSAKNDKKKVKVMKS